MKIGTVGVAAGGPLKRPCGAVSAGLGVLGFAGPIVRHRCRCRRKVGLLWPRTRWFTI